MAAPHYPGNLTAAIWFKVTFCSSIYLATLNNKNENGKIDDNQDLTSEQQEIVHFASEGVIPSTVALPDIVSLSTDYLDMTTREERIHTIKDFLSRPIIIQTGLWSSSQPAETQLYTANFPEALISNTMYQQKLTGFVGLRATLVVKVQVNSQPFQQGRLMLQYFPYAQYMPNRVSLVNSTLQGRSGCPRTDLDLSVGTEVEMRIPYVSPHVYYNLITGQGSFGAIYLVVYSQLRDQVSGTGSIEYTVWAHLEDVDVQYPTGANIYTGSSPNVANFADKMLSGKLTDGDFYEAYIQRIHKKKPSKIYAQMAAELKDLAQNHAISSGIGQVSEGLNTLSRVPVMGNIFTRPAWIASTTGNILKLFGYSKPTTQGLPCESKLRGQARMANFDGADTSHKLALSSANELETKSGLAGTSADEMDLSHVLSIPNYWDRFNWSTSDTTGVVLWDNYVTPMKIKTYSDVVADRFRCTHMGYVANTFTYWRGSIVYTFKFVKTQYHSGRLRISFIPYYFNTNISSGTPDISRTQKIVVDLRTSTEVSFTVPYVSSRPWLYCIRPESGVLDTDGSTNQPMMYNCVSGIVRVEVLNQLVAASNVHATIDCIVEVSGGPDLTFAGPTQPSYVPYAGTFTIAESQKEKAEMRQEYDDNQRANEVILQRYPRHASEYSSGPIIAQMMGESEAIPRNLAQKGVCPMPIDTHSVSANWSPEAHCIGEKVVSVRQLIKRFAHLIGYDVTDALTGPQRGSIIAPFSVKAPVTTVGAADVYMGMFDYYYYIYAFWRGSMRLKQTSNVRPTSSSGVPVGYTPRLSWWANMITSMQDAWVPLQTQMANGAIVTNEVLPNGTLSLGQSLQIIDNQVEGVIEVEVPYYNVSHISPATVFESSVKAIDNNAALRGHVPPTILTLHSQNKIAGSENAVALHYFRAPGDDYSLMYLVGVPPLVGVDRTIPSS